MPVSSSTRSSTPTPGGSSSSMSNTFETTLLNQSQAPCLKQQQQQQQDLQQQNQLTNSRPTSRVPSILDSPTLARVERACRRLEAEQQQERNSGNSACGGSSTGTDSTATTMNRENSLERSGSSILDAKIETPWQQAWTHIKRLSNNSKVNSTCNLTTPKTDVNLPKTRNIQYAEKTESLRKCLYSQEIFLRPNMQSLLAGRIPVASMTGPIKRGLLWQQRDRLFSRWKERYFVLTRDYLHCFKRASGSANERASDMGQFIFKIKLVDVEKVEWLNRRSYSVIGLQMGREGRVLLRCDDGLEDWFELLEECTVISKERRRALKIAQGPRSRASLAAPVSHTSLQLQHFGLGGNYSSALDDWLMTNGSGMGGRHKIGAGSLNLPYAGANPFLVSDSVPDLSALNNENQNHLSGISTNHSTPQKIPYSSAVNNSRYSNGYASQNHSFSSVFNVMYGSPRRIFINSNFGSNQVVDEEEGGEEAEVQLRRPRLMRGTSDNGNELDREWMYRKPNAPTDMRHSVQPMLPTTSTTNNGSMTQLQSKSDLDQSAHDSGLDTPPSTTQRPSSYRESSLASTHESSECILSASRNNLQQQSPAGGSFRVKKTLHQQIPNLSQSNGINGSRYSVHERVLKIRNEELGNRINQNELYDSNQNRYYKNGNQSPAALTPQHTPTKLHPNHTSNGNGNVTMAMAH